MISIFAKSRWRLADMQDKLERGTDGIELYISDPGDPFYDADWWNPEMAQHVVAVHAPLWTTIDRKVIYNIEYPQYHDLISLPNVAVKPLALAMGI